MILNDEGLPSLEISLEDIIHVVKVVQQEQIRNQPCMVGGGLVPAQPHPTNQPKKLGSAEAVPNVRKKSGRKGRRRRKSLVRRFRVWFKRRIYRVKKAYRHWSRHPRVAGGSVSRSGGFGDTSPKSSEGKNRH